VSPITTLAVATTVWGLVMAAAPLLQVRRIRAASSSAGVSLTHLVVLLVGFTLWLAYGVAYGLAPIVLTNVVNLCATTTWFVIAHRHRPRRAA
jgi:MtN3 and saliva related transmembrane protein